MRVGNAETGSVSCEMNVMFVECRAVSDCCGPRTDAAISGEVQVSMKSPWTVVLMVAVESVFESKPEEQAEFSVGRLVVLLTGSPLELAFSPTSSGIAVRRRRFSSKSCSAC